MLHLEVLIHVNKIGGIGDPLGAFPENASIERKHSHV